MKKNLIAILIISLTIFATKKPQDQQSWIRINLLGYKPTGIKVAVWCSKENSTITDFQIVDVLSGKKVFDGKAGKPFGRYGPFEQSFRLDFSSYIEPGRYVLHAGGVSSPEFTIAENVYKGSADFCLRYMRQQRSGFNPFLKDSCHTFDGYTLYGPMPDSSRIDVVGGWHDASDYLQYVTTSANATYQLLAAYRDFPAVFSDQHQDNGLDGENGIADVMDEARWGLNWLLKMHPKDDWMFNQLGDDRDHRGMRIPKLDSFYGRGYERPVYFCSGKPQQQGRTSVNKTTGVASTAGKFSSAFSLGYQLFGKKDPAYAAVLRKKMMSAYKLGLAKPGISQTASVLSPYIYAEENWTDDMELAAASLFSVTKEAKYLEAAAAYARKEKLTPWLGADTASHYQWYPFINVGHYELAKNLKTGAAQKEIITYYKQGIEKVWQKAKTNAFYRGVPFIWCSNNLTTSFAIQCYWYSRLTGDNSYASLEQANFDWLFGCNPWGTSMVYGLPSTGDTPVDPHSAFTHLKKYPIDGGLVDGPVYGSIYSNLIGIKLYEPDEYQSFQSKLVVYHDDYGDYSTNEPTMDGTASLIYLLAAMEQKQTAQVKKKPLTVSRGAITRGDTTHKEMAIVFTGDEFGDGGNFIKTVLKNEKVKASFFLTGNFYSNPSFKTLIQNLRQDGHYLGPHSDKHLLYCDWAKRDSLLVTKTEFTTDLLENYKKMSSYGIRNEQARFFMPPYEWYNDTISAWTEELFSVQLINFTPGTLSNADYTTPEMKNYRSSERIYQSIIDFEKRSPSGLNGFILLVHIGTDPKRTDKFYKFLPQLIKELKAESYTMVRVDQLLN